MSALPKWVVFDAVGTLIFADPPIHMAYHRIGRKHGSQVTPEQALHRFRSAMQNSTRGLQTSEQAERDFWDSIITEVLPDVADSKACLNDLWNHFATPAAWGVYMDAEEAFAELTQAGIGIAIASNFDERLHPVCDGHPELASIKQRIVSSEVGWKKPHPGFFEAISQQLQTDSQSLVMVGDDYRADIEPALQAGMRACHIDRSGQGAKETISSLIDLMPWLQERSG